MQVVDILILLFIISGGIIGAKRGAIKEFVKAISFLVITVLAFFLKNPLSIIFYENLPFFKFGGIFKGVTVLNIALYELIAFLLVFFGLMLIWRLIEIATNIIQKIINATIILGLPSKIIGFLVGIIEYYIITFIIIYILMLPMFSIKSVLESKYANKIINETPVISETVNSSNDFIKEFTDLKEKYEKTDSATEFNYDTLELFLKYDIIDIKSAKTLREKNKLKIDGVDELLKKYEEAK